MFYFIGVIIVMSPYLAHFTVSYKYPEKENNWCLFPSDETARYCGVVCFSILFTQFAIFEKLSILDLTLSGVKRVANKM